MGAACVRGAVKKSSIKHATHPMPVTSESDKTQLSDKPDSTTNIPLAEEILDDNFKAQIIQAIDQYIVFITTAYKTEHERILNEMKRSAPEPYVGLLFSEYPDVNGPTVNEMARRLAISDEAKQRLIDQVNEHIESTFLSRTADWNSTSKQTARSIVKTFIETHINNALDRVEFS